MPNAKLDFDALLKLLEFAKSRGLATQGTSSNRTRAVKAICKALPDIVTDNVDSLDIEGVLSRYDVISMNNVSPPHCRGTRIILEGR